MLSPEDSYSVKEGTDRFPANAQTQSQRWAGSDYVLLS